jgi:magnesium-transporting ATPase (P-type)
MSRAERRISRAVSVANDQSLDEYERLVRYVSVYREPGVAEVEEEGGEMKRLWYAPWKRQWVPSKEAMEARQRLPDDWLITDIKQGLSEEEVANRRRRTGWNELISQKENPIAKFMSYFQGPILYGMLADITILLLWVKTLANKKGEESHGNCCPSRGRSQRLGGFWSYHWYTVPQCLGRVVSRKASCGRSCKPQG